MTQIKSEKAKEYARNIFPLHDLSEITLRGTDFAFLAESDFMAGYELAETEAEERHAAQMQALKDELGRCERQFEHIADMATKLTTGNISHNRNYIIGNARNNAEFIRNHFTQKLTEK